MKEEEYADSYFFLGGGGMCALSFVCVYTDGCVKRAKLI